ncbi:MAG: hypothetical protein ACPGJE_08270, partial [Wenzhouxiangellaceae bacterium]
GLGFEPADDPAASRLALCGERWRRVGTRRITLIAPTAELHGGIRVLFGQAERLAQRGHRVVVACHADQALAMLDAPTEGERKVLGAFEFQPNDTVLHTDESLMPRNRRAWTSWNVRRDCGSTRDEKRDDEYGGARAGISYWMNLLQGLPGPENFLVSLNQTGRIDPDRILARRQYHHPIYTPAARGAQRALPEVNGRDRIWYCGAWTGWGFHEDAVRSARGVVDHLLEYAVRDAA